jgi:hypothetical protein
MLGAGTARRALAPALIFVACAAVYAATLGPRIAAPSGEPHYAYLADSYLHGQLEVRGKPPGDNDWARYQNRWYVSFPPFPAVVLMPFVAVWGTAVWDALIWAILAGLGPALLFVLLRSLRESGRSERSARDDGLLSVLFAFGTVYYFTAVQGTVWFAAHVVCVPLVALYLLGAFGARRPLLAGLALGLAFMTRPATLFLGIFFVAEALNATRRDDAPTAKGLLDWLGQVQWSRAIQPLTRFAIPLVLTGVVAMWLNAARFDDPFEFGHTHLQIKWRKRIETWGLFNYHYLARNLAVLLTSLPWLSAAAPYLKISRHGLALWVTTPHLLWIVWPRRVSATTTALALAAGASALMTLCYQNSGWIQFGPRFSLDYMVALFALLALGGRPFGRLFRWLVPVAIAINLFGAITFDRVPRFYDKDLTQRIIFQPD